MKEKCGMKRWAKKAALLAALALMGVIFAASSAFAAQAQTDDGEEWLYWGTGNGAECVIYGYCGIDKETLEIPPEIHVKGKTLRVIGLRYDNRNRSPNAFATVTKMTTVVIPESVTSIGDYTFGRCYNLRNVIFQGAPATIGNSVFADCSSLKSLTLPSGTVSIGNSVFTNSGLENIYIPASVKSIGAKNFNRSITVAVTYEGSPSAWQKVELHSSNTNYSLTCQEQPAPEPAAATISSFTCYATPYTTNAYVKATAQATGDGRWTQSGITIYLNGSVVAQKTENHNYVRSDLSIWYDVTQELGVTLAPDTTYTYTFFTWYDGVRYTTDGRFKTLKQATMAWTHSIGSITERGVQVTVRATANYYGNFTKYGWKLRNLTWDEDANVDSRERQGSAANYLETKLTWDTLYAGCDYTIQFWVEFDGIIFNSDWYSFSLPDYTPPVISEISNTRYHIYSDHISFNAGSWSENSGVIKKAYYKVWTEENGQDDLPENWQTDPRYYCEFPSPGSFSWNFSVYYADHNNEKNCKYIFEITYQDAAGNLSAPYYLEIFADTLPPEISNVTVSDVDDEGYTVSCDVYDASGIITLAFYTWTPDNGDGINGRDDLTAYRISDPANGTYSLRINYADHGDETLTDYVTAIYAVDERYYFSNGNGERYSSSLQNSAMATVHRDINGSRLRLPSSLEEIGADAFAGTDASFVIVPFGCYSIAAGAFDRCPNLWYIYIPPTVTVIDDQAFGSSTPKILSPDSTTAKTFAEANGLTWILCDTLNPQ